METLQGFLLALAWFLLRFVIPIGATVMVCWLFKRLDNRWKAEAEAYQKEMGIVSRATAVDCWILNNCPDERREACPAYKNLTVPCWQQFRKTNGELKEGCIGCGVFRGAPSFAASD